MKSFEKELTEKNFGFDPVKGTKPVGKFCNCRNQRVYKCGAVEFANIISSIVSKDKQRDI